MIFCICSEICGIKIIKKWVIKMVELDQFRFKLSGYTGPLKELRDSL